MPETPHTEETRLRKLADAVSAAPILVFVADAAMRYIAVSEYACDVLGYTHDELLGMRVTDVAVGTAAAGDYHRMIESGWLVGISRLRCKDGTDVVMRYRAGETDVEGKPAYVAFGWIE